MNTSFVVVAGDHNNVICHYVLLVVRLVESCCLLVKWLPQLNVLSSTNGKPGHSGPLLRIIHILFYPAECCLSQLHKWKMR